MSQVCLGPASSWRQASALAQPARLAPPNDARLPALVEDASQHNAEVLALRDASDQMLPARLRCETLPVDLEPGIPYLHTLSILRRQEPLEREDQEQVGAQVLVVGLAPKALASASRRRASTTAGIQRPERRRRHQLP